MANQEQWYQEERYSSTVLPELLVYDLPSIVLHLFEFWRVIPGKAIGNVVKHHIFYVFPANENVFRVLVIDVKIDFRWFTCE
jgi:hypothetical protein